MYVLKREKWTEFISERSVWSKQQLPARPDHKYTVNSCERRRATLLGTRYRTPLQRLPIQSLLPGLLVVAMYLSGGLTVLPRLVTCAYDGACCSCSGSGLASAWPLSAADLSSRCFGGRPLLGGIAGSVGWSGSAFAGFSLSTLTLSSPSPHCMTKYLPCFWRTLYGPVYGVCSGLCAASRLTKTYSASSNPFAKAMAFVPCHASGAGTSRPAMFLIFCRCSVASGLLLGPTKVPGTVNVVPYTISATEVPKSSFGMVLSPNMTQGSSSIHA